jgi:hypothetical protein
MVAQEWARSFWWERTDKQQPELDLDGQFDFPNVSPAHIERN